ncbi:secreted RxLR effector protein 161-like [Lycium ferocissimum]|uniref:secreted RxLR effector protein 161-like n=1 Tax=Lycium ferocissimum TaxID=112874 RepID=UPI002815682C|nr:secreted RxLR effector protein 161-like [Lycium ferocissimum]
MENKEMEMIPYASVVGSLMYAQVCTRLDIAYIIGMLGKYLRNQGIDHWKVIKRFLRYLERTKEHMFTFKRLDNVEIIGYLASAFAGCQDSLKYTSGFIVLLAGGVVS